MSKDEAVKILKDYRAWLKGENNTLKPHLQAEAVDFVIELLERPEPSPCYYYGEEVAGMINEQQTAYL